MRVTTYTLKYVFFKKLLEFFNIARSLEEIGSGLGLYAHPVYVYLST